MGVKVFRWHGWNHDAAHIIANAMPRGKGGKDPQNGPNARSSWPRPRAEPRGNRRKRMSFVLSARGRKIAFLTVKSGAMKIERVRLRKVQVTELRDTFLPSSGACQSIFHIGRFAEWRKCGELAFSYLDELLNDRELIEMIEAAVAPVPTWETKHFDSLFQFRLFRILLYIVLRVERPAVVVETGVLHGLTTLFLLRALERNGGGRLVSVDLPSYAESGPTNQDGYVATLPKGCEPGWIVPRQRYPDWQLLLGASRDVLPGLDAASGAVDLFCHDSEHTFPVMWFELDWAWRNLSEDGLIVCDNIESNTSFADFCRKVGRDGIYFPAPDTQIASSPRFGMLRK